MNGASMFRSREGQSLFLLVLLSAGYAACHGLEDVACGGLGCDATDGVNQVGTINVTTRTTGADLDPDGYQVTAGTITRSMAPDDFERFQNLTRGSTTVTLAGLAENCTVADNPRQITVSITAVASTTFDVVCITRTGTLTVGVQTVGPANHTGYTVTAAGQTKSLGLAGSTSFGSVPVGDYSVVLGGLPAGCFVTLLPNPRTVTVTFSQGGFTRFDVDCGGQNGSLDVTTVTTGIDLDPNGYIVTVGQTPIAIGVNATTRLDQVAPGVDTVQLSDVASHCIVTGANPRNVTITALTLSQTRFDVLCGAEARIAFKSDQGGDEEIWSVLPDGRNPRQLTTDPADDFDPDWSPDGLRIAFSRGGDIWVMNADGTNQHPVLTTPFQDDQEPDWSPDGLRLVFEGPAADGTREIFVMDASSGGNLRQLTNAGGNSFRPHFSPNGANIVFSSDRFGNLDVFTMLADGSLQVQLTTSPAADDYPAWSPTGGQIIFASKRDSDGDGELFVMNANGSNQTQRTFNTSNESGPAWGADGTIAFVTDRNVNKDIYLLFPNGLELQLTSNAADEEHPDWRNVPPPSPPPTQSPASLGEGPGLLPAGTTRRNHR